MNQKKNKKIFIKNRKATFEYNIIDQYTSGIMLCGTEVKSIRQNKASINEAFCYISNGELFIKQMNIAKYEYGNINNHQESRTRKLLLQKNEIDKLMKSKIKGMTIIPLYLFLNDRGLIKLEIALARGKKLFDKRNSIKEKDIKRQEGRDNKLK